MITTSFRKIWIPVCLAAFVLACSPIALAHDGDEKRPLSHEDYDKWNSVTGQNISNDGSWIAYTIRPGKGDSTLKIRSTRSATEYSVLRGSSARFSFDGKYICYVIQPDPEVIKKLRKEKKKPAEYPQPKLEILNLETGKHTTIDQVRSYSMPAEASGWIAYMMIKPADEETVKQGKSNVTESYEISSEGLTKPNPKTNKKPGKAPQTSEEQSQSKPAESEKKESPAKNDKKKKEKATGSILVLRNLDTGIEQRYPNATSFTFCEDGSRMAFATSADESEGDGVFVVEPEKNRMRQIISGLGNYRSLSFNKPGKELAFFSDRDDYEAEKPAWGLYHWRDSQKSATKIADKGIDGVPENWWVASTASPVFTEDGKRLLFSTAPIPDDVNEPTKEDEEEEPVAKLDVWHWKDPLLQPQQLVQANQIRNRSYRAAYDLRSKKIVQLATEEIPTVSVDPRSTSDFALGIAAEQYHIMRSWEYPYFQDTYLVNLKTGEATLLLEKVRGNPSLSPGGKFLTWWDSDLQKWQAVATAKPGKVFDIAKGLKFPLANELHDTPSPAGSYGSAGWLDNDAAFLIYDRYDIWALDPNGKQKPRCVTRNAGRENKIRFRYTRLDFDLRSINPKSTVTLSAFDETTKASGYYELDLAGDQGPTEKLVLDERVSSLRKARDSDDVMLTRSTFRRSPDIWASTMDFGSLQRISKANPQQHEYLWGTAELVHWKSATGQDLDGLLYKPEGFDPNQKYPMMVYFYERMSDNLHRYIAPGPSRSSINFSFYVSRGYLLFVPDIPYRIGEPGNSCVESVVPGVESIVAKGFVDENAIGVQGHSWGGYQIAYMVTKTNLFAAAESGAPVSNMTSAYGGIRWASGMSRMFQYERTQSRIGEPLWEARDKYIANSPLFFVDKIETPLLILHNDEDGAVPWYQGIELFVAMRRLSKPAWMLNYNGEAHGITRRENQHDFAIRMQQFFDHYLKGEPAPRWMTHGVPAVDKGKEYGLEVAEEEEVAGEEEE